MKQLWSYFTSHRVSGTAFTNSAPLDHTYTIDNLNRMITSTQGDYPNNTQRSLTYDNLGRLRAFSDSAYANPSEWVCPTGLEEDCYTHWYYSLYEIRRDTMAYDAVGNPTLNSASVGTGNRLTYYNGFTMTYDTAGNMLTKASPFS